MRVKIVNINIETVAGKKNYRKATVIYSFNGQARTQNVMDFANPAVFKQLAEWDNTGLPTEEVEVEVGKNSGGFNEWRSIGNAPASDGPTQPTGPSVSAPKAGSFVSTGRDFETREERAARQVLIVKQSSLAQAVEFLGPQSTGTTEEEVLETAQRFADWVFDNGSDE